MPIRCSTTTRPRSTRLRDAGAVLVAKLSTGELAVGDLWFRDRTRNPWNPERGSSGSSAGPASATVGRPRRLRRRHRNRWLDRLAGEHVRRRRPASDVWARQPLRLHDAALDARQGRAAHAIGRRRGAGARRALHGPDGRDETVPDLPFTWDGGRDVKGLRIGYIERELTGTGDRDDRNRSAARRPLATKRR